MMKKILVQFAQREAHPVIQFVKYGMCGSLATLVDIVVFSILAWKVFPALQTDELIVTLLQIEIVEVSEKIRSIHYVIDRSITFGYLVSYRTNSRTSGGYPGHRTHVDLEWDTR